MINVRPAIRLDAGSMAKLLNEIIELGGTTALVRPVTGGDLADWMAVTPDRAAWHVELDGGERVVGFQWISPHENSPQTPVTSPHSCRWVRPALASGQRCFLQRPPLQKH